MPINFNAKENKSSYVGRSADVSWKDAMEAILDPAGLCVADIGCGGGIYSRAWLELGVSQVIGIDKSQTMIDAAVENCSDLNEVWFREGDAANTGLEGNSVDVVFERALIHHLPDITPCLMEAQRILRPGGTLILQDRTPEDASLPGSPEHIRGYFFECFPHLLQIEHGRRRTKESVFEGCVAAGFEAVRHITVWETRKIYAFREGLLDELRQRKGRSILHELTDSELESLVSLVASKLPAVGEVIEKDRWTIWIGKKPRT